MFGIVNFCEIDLRAMGSSLFSGVDFLLFRFAKDVSVHVTRFVVVVVKDYAMKHARGRSLWKNSETSNKIYATDVCTVRNYLFKMRA